MEYKNSYFQLVIGERNVAMNYYPPVDGGESLNLDEIVDYLDSHGIKDYDIKKINETILTATKPIKITISNETAFPVDDLCHCQILST